MNQTTFEAFNQALAQKTAKLPQVVVLDDDIASAASLSQEGKIPVFKTSDEFLVGHLKILIEGINLKRANVKIAAIRERGEIDVLSALRGLPGLVILQPADALETSQAVEWMLGHQGPVYLRLAKGETQGLHKPDYKFRFGQADTLWEPDSKTKHFQATVFASGTPAQEAVAAAKNLLAKGFSVQAVNVGTIQPFDADAVEAAAVLSGRLVTVEDHPATGGLGSAVCEAAAYAGAAVPVIRLGGQNSGEAAIIEACLRHLG